MYFSSYLLSSLALEFVWFFLIISISLVLFLFIKLFLISLNCLSEFSQLLCFFMTAILNSLSFRSQSSRTLLFAFWKLVLFCYHVTLIVHVVFVHVVFEGLFLCWYLWNAFIRYRFNNWASWQRFFFCFPVNEAIIQVFVLSYLHYLHLPGCGRVGGWCHCGRVVGSLTCVCCLGLRAPPPWWRNVAGGGRQVCKPVVLPPGSLWLWAPQEAVDASLLLLGSGCTWGREPHSGVLLPVPSARCGMGATSQILHHYCICWGWGLSQGSMGTPSVGTVPVSPRTASRVPIRPPSDLSMCGSLRCPVCWAVEPLSDYRSLISCKFTGRWQKGCLWHHADASLTFIFKRYFH